MDYLLDSLQYIKLKKKTVKNDTSSTYNHFWKSHN